MTKFYNRRHDDPKGWWGWVIWLGANAAALVGITSFCFAFGFGFGYYTAKAEKAVAKPTAETPCGSCKKGVKP